MCSTSVPLVDLLGNENVSNHSMPVKYQTCYSSNEIVKYSKGQLISKAIFLVSFEPKNERNYFFLFDLF